MNFILEYYIWWKALHIIFVVSWFAALFYLPRLFVYHAQALRNNDNQVMQYFQIMEKKLYTIGHIGMGMAIVFGILMLIANNNLIQQGWMHLKLFLVVLLIIYYCYCGRIMRKFAKGIELYSETFYRWFNEFPAVLLIAIIFIVFIR